jgi:hypothetical protein
MWSVVCGLVVLPFNARVDYADNRMWKMLFGGYDVKHYIDRSGKEVIWQGLSHEIGDHEYYCAHHSSVELLSVTAETTEEADGVRSYGGGWYRCWLCDQESGRATQPFANEFAQAWANQFVNAITP